MTYTGQGRSCSSHLVRAAPQIESPRVTAATYPRCISNGKSSPRILAHCPMCENNSVAVVTSSNPSDDRNEWTGIGRLSLTCLVAGAQRQNRTSLFFFQSVLWTLFMTCPTRDLDTCRSKPMPSRPTSSNVRVLPSSKPWYARKHFKLADRPAKSLEITWTSSSLKVSASAITNGGRGVRCLAASMSSSDMLRESPSSLSTVLISCRHPRPRPGAPNRSVAVLRTRSPTLRMFSPMRQLRARPVRSSRSIESSVTSFTARSPSIKLSTGLSQVVGCGGCRTWPSSHSQAPSHGRGRCEYLLHIAPAARFMALMRLTQVLMLTPTALGGQHRRFKERLPRMETVPRRLVLPP